MQWTVFAVCVSKSGSGPLFQSGGVLSMSHLFLLFMHCLVSHFCALALEVVCSMVVARSCIFRVEQFLLRGCLED